MRLPKRLSEAKSKSLPDYATTRSSMQMEIKDVDGTKIPLYFYQWPRQ
jgi:hypothetical protein